MSITVSNVTISFPPNTRLPGDASMTVACTIDGLKAGETPRAMFPGAAMSTDMSGSDTSWSASSAPEMFSPGQHNMAIAGVPVRFELDADAAAKNIHIG